MFFGIVIPKIGVNFGITIIFPYLCKSTLFKMVLENRDEPPLLNCRISSTNL